MNRIMPLLILIAACNKPLPVDLSEKSLIEILNSDREMSAMAGVSGFNKALLSFAHDSLVKPEEGKFPILGKKALEAAWTGNDGTKGLSWEPFKAEAASSGDLGYTIGNWKFVTTDTTYYGNYFTAWKKGADGTWKWVVDGGNNTPAPK